MGFFLRKSLKVGPVRLNLSKSGVGVSAGVKGARVGVRPDGRAYTHAGRFGLYHREELGKIGGKSQAPEPAVKGKIKMESIRAHLDIAFEREQAIQMWQVVREQGNTPEAMVEVLESVSDSPKFWDALLVQDDWKDSVNNLWEGLADALIAQDVPIQ